MLDVDLTPYDVIIATPPCNYYSKLNRFRETAKYSQETKHLLPDIIRKLNDQEKPYIVENVRGHIINKLIAEQTDYKGYIYQHGRHTYWTNVPFNPKMIEQTTEFKASISRKSVSKEDFKKLCSAIKTKKNVQGGNNVYNVIEYWLQVVKETYYN